MRRLRRRTQAEWLSLTAILALVAALAAWQSWLWRADYLIYDLGLSLGGRVPPSDLVIIAIDDESLARIGRWPWRRAVHATLLEKLRAADVAVVGMDIILTESDGAEADGDRLLAEAIRKNGRVILPVVQRSLGPGLIAEGRPIPILADAAAGLGHIELALDADGIFRSIYLWGGIGSAKYPQLALAMMQFVTPEIAAKFGKPADRETVATGFRQYWMRDLWTHVKFAGPPGTYKTISYVDVLTGAVPDSELAGKRVLIGATAAGLGDILPTPMSSLGRPMPGVEIHATVFDALRLNDMVTWLPPGSQIAITVTITIALMLGLLFFSPRNGLIMSAATGGMVLLGTLLLLSHGGIWIPPSAALFTAALAYPLWSWRRLEAAQRYMDAELKSLHEMDPNASDVGPLAKSFDPLEARINIVRAVAQRQRAIQKTRDDTMRFISHDIRSPLASVITLIDGANHDAGNDQSEKLTKVGRYAQIALDLADDFFRLARAETLDSRKFIELDLTSLAQEAADEVWALAQAKGIRISISDEGPGECLILGDASLLSRALTNLLNNAIKYSADNTEVNVTIREAGPFWELAVEDKGFGIAAEDMSRLFNRYERIIRDDQPVQPGVGLGLVIVKTIVEKHGGQITVESRLGEGTTFLIKLPVASASH